MSRNGSAGAAAVLALTLAAACAPPTTPVATHGAPKSWNAMTREERGRYMGEVVLPQMRTLFQRFDAQRFAAVNCRTCHGAGAEDHTFRMPDTELARLPDDAAGFQALAREKPEWMHFMADEVRPRMAALLGKKEVDMRHPDPDAFGCRDCHVLGQAPERKAVP